MLKTKKSKILVLFLLLFLFLGASFVFAQKSLEVTYPQIPGALTPTTTKTALPDYIRYIFQLSLFVGALIAFGSFIYGGVRYLISGGSPSAQKDAQSQMSAGILGLIILISTYIILNTINPQLVTFEVSLPPGISTTLRAPAPSKIKPASYVEIPLGGLIENLWVKKNVECYYFDENGNRTSNEPFKNQDRLKCIRGIPQEGKKGLAEAIQIKAQRLKEPVEELQKLYDCQNCCRDCCKNVCNWAKCSEICTKNELTGNWENCNSSNPSVNSYCQGTKNEGCWESCGLYPSCENRGMVREYYYQECPANSCEFFQECKCQNCGFESSEIPRTNCICIKKDKEGKPVCCNFERDPTRPYEDLLVRSLIDKNLLTDEEKEIDPYKDLKDIKTALKELRLKLGLFPLTEEMEKNKVIACPPSGTEMGVLDCLLSDESTKDLIKEILVGDSQKLKTILGIKSVMKYLVESDLLSTDKNLAKTMLRALDLLENEVAINEVAWMGTQASPTDQWIELYNNTKENIDLTKWKLVVKNKFKIDLSGTIPAQGFYLLENNENTISDITADLVYNGNLSDSGEILLLYDEFGNLVEEVNFDSGWPAGDFVSKTSMERMNPQGSSSEEENWGNNYSIKVNQERKGDFINGKDGNQNPIYGTPRNPNSIGMGIIPYPDFNSLVSEMRSKLRSEENLREKLILVLRQEENLERMLKSEEALKNILVGDDTRLRNLLSIREVLQILLEEKENLNLLIADPHTKEVIKEILIRTGDWKTEDDEKDEWQELFDNLEEVRINIKLIDEFQRDLLWVLDASDLMRGCQEDPVSYDQLRTPEVAKIKIEEVPEWKEISREIPWLEGFDPAIFYCHEPLW
jgi:hypothetical protein